MGLRLDRVLFPEGKEKAVTFSFDDAVVEDVRMATLLRKYQIKATFNINCGCFGEKNRMPIEDRELYHEVITEEQLSTIYADQEVACHGFHHLSMTDCSEDSALAEAVLDRAKLEQLLHRRVRGFAYPYGHYNTGTMEILKKAGYRYARTVNRADSFDLPENFLAWDASCHIFDSDRDQLWERFMELKPSPYSPSPKIFYIWGHSYEMTIADGWIDWELFLQKVSGHKSLWYATNGEIQSYMEAVQRLDYSVDRSIIFNPSATAVWLELDGHTVKLEGGKETVI
ncbi:MAG: polysaccharide deacetylase family protein [Lachnospiraceae bacterium]|nr:polysaccharide deacetylase family protein [Lachnospiraceae bacterium]